MVKDTIDISIYLDSMMIDLQVYHLLVSVEMGVACTPWQAATNRDGFTMHTDSTSNRTLKIGIESNV